MKFLVWFEFSMRQPLRELLDEYPHFHSSNVFSHALVGAIPKRQMIHSVISVEVEDFWVFELSLIVIGGCHNDQ